MAGFTKSYLLLAVATTAMASPAFAKSEVHPFIEVGQVVTTDIKGGDDSVLTYSTVAAGVDANVANRLGEFNVNYRYERRFDYQKNGIGDDDVHTGLARGRIDIVPNALSIEAGALATRARADIRGRGAGAIQGAGNVSNVTQVYSAYAGPSFESNVGPLDVAAAYRFGYNRVEEPNSIQLAPGQRPLDLYDDSTSHFATASVGMSPESSVLPVGWSVSGGYERENASQLKQVNDSKYVRGDLVVPITPSIAIVGGVGYEQTKGYQRDARIDPLTGQPVVDGKGRFVTDPASPKRLSYDFDGVYWDTGVMWKPSDRTQLEARVGRRYGSMTYTGSFSWQTGENSGLQVEAFDEVQTFGQALTDNLAMLPVNFRTPQNARLNNGFGGCTFGGDGAFGGRCLGDALGSVNTSAYRSRGVEAVLTGGRGRWNHGVGLSYTQRKYLAPVQAGLLSLQAVKDQSVLAQANIDYELSQRTNIATNFYGEYFMPGQAGAGNVLTTGATSTLTHRFGRNLSGMVAVGVFSDKVEDFQSVINVSGEAGLRLQF